MKSSRNKINTRDWLIIAGLIILSLVPAIAGSVRMIELASGAEVTPDNARFFASPLPVIFHIISSIVYSILGAFQFAPGFRRWRPRWHRTTGWLLAPSGLVVALSGLWMTHFYQLPELDGEILYVLRLLVGSVMLLSILLGVAAIWRRDFAGHGDWMIRAYAIGLGAGTQVFTHLPWTLFIGTLDEFTRAILMGAGWVINIVLAEWIIFRKWQRRLKRRHSTQSFSRQATIIR
jgi:uncharacterized membrane protein